jgi:hypothetical protein
LAGLFFYQISGLTVADIENLLRLACGRGGPLNVENSGVVCLHSLKSFALFDFRHGFGLLLFPTLFPTHEINIAV